VNGTIPNIGPMAPGPAPLSGPVDLKALLERLGLTEDDLAAMFEAGTFGEQNALAKEQTSMAEALRGTQMPQGRQMGDIYVPPSILENAAATLKQIIGQRDSERAMEERRQMIDMLRKGRQAGGTAALVDRFGNPMDPRAYDYTGTGY